jgi:hypothetical protein
MPKRFLPNTKVCCCFLDSMIEKYLIQNGSLFISQRAFLTFMGLGGDGWFFGFLFWLRC